MKRKHPIQMIWRVVNFTVKCQLKTADTMEIVRTKVGNIHKHIHTWNVHWMLISCSVRTHIRSNMLKAETETDTRTNTSTLQAGRERERDHQLQVTIITLKRNKVRRATHTHTHERTVHRQSESSDEEKNNNIYANKVKKVYEDKETKAYSISQWLEHHYDLLTYFKVTANRNCVEINEVFIFSRHTRKSFAKQGKVQVVFARKREFPLWNRQKHIKMGRIFLDHINGTKLYSCASCDTNLTNKNELISTRFTGATGKINASLFVVVVVVFGMKND